MRSSGIVILLCHIATTSAASLPLPMADKPLGIKLLGPRQAPSTKKAILSQEVIRLRDKSSRGLVENRQQSQTDVLVCVFIILSSF